MDAFETGGREMENFASLVKTMKRLRSTEGCPWDREQTHESLKRNLLEECYEVLEAIDSGDTKKLSEELGDVLLQVLFHVQISEESQGFDLNSVIQNLNEKLIRRHPHVFSNEHNDITDSETVEKHWERYKKDERGDRSPVDGIPGLMPSLAYSQLMLDRVSKAGFHWRDISSALHKVSEEIGELHQAVDIEDQTKEFGDLLLALVNLARWYGIQAEDALRRANMGFSERYKTMERLAVDRGLDIKTLDDGQGQELWYDAKKISG